MGHMKPGRKNQTFNAFVYNFHIFFQNSQMNGNWLKKMKYFVLPFTEIVISYTVLIADVFFNHTLKRIT